MQLVVAAKFGQTGPNSSGKSQGLFNLDEEVDNRGDLPERYSDLTDAHFPLFVTYDQVCIYFCFYLSTPANNRVDS